MLEHRRINHEAKDKYLSEAKRETLLQVKNMKQMLTKTKIPDFNVVASVKKYIIRCQVPMNNALSMDMCQAFYNLSEQMPCKFLV